MNAGHDEFFAVIGEGAHLLATLDENADEFFASLNRLREILAMIGESVPAAPASITFSLADKAATVASLTAYLATGLDALPPALAAFEAETVQDLALVVGDSDLARDASNWTAKGDRPQTHQAGTKAAVFEHFVRRGIMGEFDLEAIQQAVQDGDALLKTSYEKNPAFMAVMEKYQAFANARGERFIAFDAAIKEADEVYRALLKDGDTSANDMAAAMTKLDELFNQRSDYSIESANVLSALGTDVREAREAFQAERAAKYAALYEENGRAIIGKLLEASPITDEQAQAWADEQIIDDNTKAKLKRLKPPYPADQLRRDMAEYYRLTGGKASALRIAAGGRRANAVGVDTRAGEKIINIDTSFNKVTLFHELAHHLENDPIAKAAANGFLEKRRESEKVYTLRSLTGNKGYRSDEVAYKDGFINPYVGKVYRGGITEVWSMAVQYLANPRDAAILAGRDPEMLDMVTGYLRNPATPAMHAKLNMHTTVIDEAKQRAADSNAQYAGAIAWLAERAPLVKDNWFEQLDPAGEDARMLDQQVLWRAKKGVAQYVGACGKFRVFSGVFRNPDTKRAAKGYMVVEMRGNSRPDVEIVIGDMEEVQSFCAVATINGTGLWDAKIGYFYYQDARKKVIELVEGLQ
jgi:hypothetical protein